jgi:hypothetical protein
MPPGPNTCQTVWQLLEDTQGGNWGLLPDHTSNKPTYLTSNQGGAHMTTTKPNNKEAGHEK